MNGHEVFGCSTTSRPDRWTTSSISATAQDFHLVVDSVLHWSVVNERRVYKCDVVVPPRRARGRRAGSSSSSRVQTLVTNLRVRPRSCSSTAHQLRQTRRSSRRAAEVYGDVIASRSDRSSRPTGGSSARPRRARTRHTQTRKAMDEFLDSYARRYELPYLDCRHRAPVQHGRPAAERAVRDGRSSRLRPARARRRRRSTIHGGRRSDPVLLRTSPTAIRRTRGTRWHARDVVERSTTSGRRSASRSTALASRDRSRARRRAAHDARDVAASAR